MGNRGRLHDERRSIVRNHQLERWILCLLDFKGRRRTVMSPRTYTELFFLDEVTGLAAGHRPCFECQRARYRAFVDAWARGNPSITAGAVPSAPELDAVLHRERMGQRREKRVHETDFADLADGAMVLLGRNDQAFLVRGGALYPWSFAGYGAPLPRPDGGSTRLLTPPSIVNALAAGYVASMHPSALGKVFG